MPAHRILVVDDDETFLFIIREVLVNAGFDVDLAANGREAILQLDKNTPEVVLIDVMMPDTDGIALCKEIRGRAATEDIPIFMVSALGDAHTINGAYMFGANDYFVKPVDPQLLVKKITKVLNSRGKKFS